MMEVKDGFKKGVVLLKEKAKEMKPPSVFVGRPLRIYP
jgi:hypothetical protein